MHFGSIFVPVSLVLTLLWWFWAKPALERQEAREAGAKAERRKNAELRAWLDDLTARREAHKAERERPDPTPGEIAEMRAELLAYGRPAALLQRLWPPAPRQVALRSYFGGLPRLAPDQVWPVGEDGHALTFLCQIDLGELPAEVATVAEGLEGTLLFFSNTNFDGVGDPWSAVLYQPGRGDAFEERAPPATLMLAGGWQEAQLYPWLEAEEDGARGDLRQAMTFVPFTSYADTQGDAVALWNTRTAHQMAYQTSHESLPVIRSSFPKHQMFGYGLSVQNAVGEHWDDILLLQIGCEDDLAWAKHCGYGVLQFWISPEALAARRFSEVTVTFETD